MRPVRSNEGLPRRLVLAQLCKVHRMQVIRRVKEQVKIVVMEGKIIAMGMVALVKTKDISQVRWRAI